jgi:hypothetical protein
MFWPSILNFLSSHPSSFEYFVRFQRPTKLVTVAAMYLLNTVSAVLAFSSSALAFPFPSDSSKDVTFKSSIFEKLAAPPAGWAKDDTVQFDKDASTVRLRIHLVQQSMEEFHDLAMKVFKTLLISNMLSEYSFLPYRQL